MKSDDLLAICHTLSQDASWEKFCHAFDDERCVKRRLETREAVEGRDAAPFVEELKNLCLHLEHHELHHDGWRFFLPSFETKEAEAEDLAMTAFSLVQKVRSLLSTTEFGKTCREMLVKEVESQRNRAALPEHRPRRIGHEAILSLVGFIKRESRLPSKKELNIEAGRRNRAEMRSVKRSFQHGEKIPDTDFWWQVQSCEKRYTLNGYTQKLLSEPLTGFYFDVELIRCTSEGNEWESGRWGDKEFGQDILAPFGLSGLPKHRRR